MILMAEDENRGLTWSAVEMNCLIEVYRVTRISMHTLRIVQCCPLSVAIGPISLKLQTIISKMSVYMT